jgi:hypothetical protein
MAILHAAIEIDAPAARVWDVLVDLQSYVAWNPFIVQASGQPRVGERLDITIAAPGLKPVSFRPRVLDFQPGHLLRWKGEYKVPGLFDGRHALVVDALGPDRTRFTTHEEVSGVLLPFLGKVMRASQDGFEQMASALKDRAEELERAGAAAG